jgi:hypothetical protein
VMAADQPTSGRRLRFPPWTTERDVNPRCFDRIRFESVPTELRGDVRQHVSPQLAWEARRKHAPCAIPVPVELGMDCIYLREETENDYVHALAVLTAQNPPVPEGDVNLDFICQSRPLLPLRWPPSGRKTVNPEKEFSPRGELEVPGEPYARDSKYSLYMSSLLAGHGDPGRFFEELRKEAGNRRAGMLVSWSQVEYYRIPAGMRTTLYPRVPADWDEWEVPNGMNVPLPAVLAYRGSALIRGDALHWCIFRTEWVISAFARFVADAIHRKLLWHLSPRVLEAIARLGLEPLLEGSEYPGAPVRQLLALQAKVDWEEWAGKGYSRLRAVPIQLVGETYLVQELTVTGVIRRMTEVTEGDEVEEIVASGCVGEAPARPATPILSGTFTETCLGEGSVSRRTGPFIPVSRPREERLPTVGRLDTLTGARVEGISPVTYVATGFASGERQQGRKEGMIDLSGNHGSPAGYAGRPTLGDYRQDVGYPAAAAESVLIRDVEASLQYQGWSDELRTYMQGARLSESNIAGAIGGLLASRDYHRRRGEDLTRRVQALEAERASRELVERSTAQSLRLLTWEMQRLSEQVNQQVGRDRTEEGEGERALKRSRTGL